MLVWSSFWRGLVWTITILLFLIVYGLPIGVIVLASFSAEWSDLLPGRLTLESYGRAFRTASYASLKASFITGIVASLVALVSGTWAALALRNMKMGVPRRVLDACFFIPSAVPSVSIGLALLIAFSPPPFLLNGTRLLVMFAHFTLISAFTFGNVSAGLARIPADCEQVAESLGARPFYRMRRVTLPLLLPYLIAAFSLSFALSMGELGATVMVYPAGWTTLPVRIFTLTDRGAVFDAATLATILGTATLVMLIVLSRISNRAALR